MTADVTYRLKNDLLETPEEELSWRDSPPSAQTAVLPIPATKLGGAKPWREAVMTSNLCKPIAAVGDRAKAAELAALAADLVDICWAVCERASSMMPGNPWHDEHYPTRVLDRLDVVIGSPPSAEEAVFLLVTPFVREAIFAAGVLWMADANPMCVTDTGAAAEPRNTLEQIHRGRPDLLRRIERLAGTEREAVCYWMMGQALQHSPHLWDRTPKIMPMRMLQQKMESVTVRAGSETWLGIDSLIRLAWCVAAAPETLEGESGILREDIIERGGARLRLAKIAQLLSLSGLEALDLRTADELVVDHVGREEFTPKMLCDSLRAAQWFESGGRHQLTLKCEHPVVDYALETMVTRARIAAERIRQTTDNEGRPFLNVPAGIVAHTGPAAGPDGRPRYRRPLVHFRLDHNRIRELLMGEHLYGDPALAIRELYQNALDACRYRQARVTFLKRRADYIETPYEGRIRFQQGIDAAGRAFIECVDNGIGMTPAILEHVFAVAGQQFYNLPDFVEERAAWKRSEPPIELYPNSQFGIGVLSYFMLADEIMVTTRRYKRDGLLGTALTVRISSASGLFRLEEVRDEEMPEAGTRVRLLLARETYQKEHKTVRVSVCSILKDLLWIADFDTAADEADHTRLHWPAGVLAPGGACPPGGRFCATEDPDVHWVGIEDGDDTLRVPVLVDGIVTDESRQAVLVNLRGPRYPRLTVDRKNIREWEGAWVEGVLAKSGHKLIGWVGLTFEWLWIIERLHLRAARAAFQVLLEADARLSLSLHRPEATALIRDLGCFCADRFVLMRLQAGKRPEHLWEAWRATILIAAGFVSAFAEWAPPPRLAGVNIPCPPPGLSSLMSATDEMALRRANTASITWLDTSRSSLAIFNVALQCQETAAVVVDWLKLYLPLCIQIPEIPECQKNLIPQAIDVDLVPLMKSNRPTPMGAILRVAVRHNVSIRDILERCALLGMVLPPLAWANLANVVPVQNDVLLLSRDLDGVAPWISADITFSHVHRACRILRMKLQAVIDRLKYLEPLGVLLLDAPEGDVLAAASESDRYLLSENLNGLEPWLSGDVPLGHIVTAALKLEMLPSGVIERLKSYAALLNLRVPDFSLDRLDAAGLGERDLKWLSISGNGRAPWRAMVVPVGAILRLVHSAGMDITWLVGRCREVGVEFLGDVERLQSMDGLSREEQLYLFGGGKDFGALALEGGASSSQIVATAQRCECTVDKALKVASRLGLVEDAERIALATFGDHRPDVLDARLWVCFSRYPLRLDRIYDDAVAWARLQIWEINEEELSSRVERFRSALDQMIAGRWSRNVGAV